MVDEVDLLCYLMIIFGFVVVSVKVGQLDMVDYYMVFVCKMLEIGNQGVVQVLCVVGVFLVFYVDCWVSVVELVVFEVDFMWESGLMFVYCGFFLNMLFYNFFICFDLECVQYYGWFVMQMFCDGGVEFGVIYFYFYIG